MTADAPAGSIPFFEGHVRKEADREVIGLGERVGSVVAIPFIVFFVLVLMYIQGRGYLFTEEFDLVDEVLLYGTILYGIVPNVVRAVTARRNLGRLLDIIGSLLGIVAGIYFLLNWPFDFSTLYLAFPEEVQFAFMWITDPIAMFLLAVGVVISGFSVVYNGLMYVLVRNELQRRSSGSAR